MPPQPLESNQMQVFNEGQQNRFGSIALSVLIDFIVQRTYHELTVLAELLPRKTDMERKIEIYNFSARTRQLFIRLLALVKWASSAAKVDTSAKIMSFLDKQSMLFVETADVLARMSRETLVHARLPNFHIPAAVEVLTTGTYGRLPAVIREKIVPPDPITLAEKKYTLNRLNQVIEHRLVTGNLLPQLRKFSIKDGRVTFHVKHEFEVSLTVMGDGPNIPWRLLDIDILVEDKETGDGKALVHTLQVHYIHKLIQARLVENENALAEVYNCLHYFCQSLQLEVLYQQTIRLARDRLDDNIRVDNYVAGSKLTISYWRELAVKDSKAELGFRLTVQTDPSNNAKPLAVLHIPSIGSKESEVARAIRSDLLSMERLLVHTVYLRSLVRLNDLKVEFQTFMKDSDFHLQGTPAILTVPVLNPCLRAEQIHITVDTHTGFLHCHVPKHLDCPIVSEFQNVINNDHKKLRNLVSELRYWIAQRRCEKTLQHLPATLHEKIPLIFPPNHAIAKIGKHKVFIQLHRHPSVVLIVELKEKVSCPNEIEYTFFLVYVKSVSYEEKPAEDTTLMDTVPTITAAMTSIEKGAKMFLAPISLIEFDTFVATHGPGTYVDDSSSNKRKSSGVETPAAKQQKTIYPAYFIPELAHIVAMCDEKLPFVMLAQELTKRKIPHSGLQVEANATSLVLKLLSLPQPLPMQPQQTPVAQQTATPGLPGAQQQPQQQQPPLPEQGKTINTPKIEKKIWNALLKRLLSVSIRAQFNKINQTRIWTVEFVFCGTPLPSSHGKEQGQRRAVYLQYEMLPAESIHKTVDLFLNDWSKIVYLYCLVHDFSEFFQKDKFSLQSMITIKQYSYNNLLLAYGPNKQVNVNIYWCIEAKEFKLIFIGGNRAINGHSMMRDQMQTRENNAINAHSMMRDQLQTHLNRYYNLAQTVHLLHETYQPLSSIAKLPIIPQLGILTHKMPVLTFCILPQSATLLRVAFQGTYCLEIRLRSGLVSIRDGAYSRFDRSNVVEEFTPTQGLKGFLSKYVDESAVYRRRSQSEDDNPPSPITMDDPPGGPNSVGSSFLSSSNIRAPQSPRDAGTRNISGNITTKFTRDFAPHPLTPPSGSNPHTPASPHQIGQNHPNFNMTSPPAPHMPHPSPGAGIMPPSSPLNAQPSPMAHSPNPNSLSYMQSHPEGSSPFTSLSPAASNWPGSPGIPRPSPRPGQSPDHRTQQIIPHHSRVLPSRSWAGAVPTLLTHEALDTLCSQGSHPQKEIPGPDLSPLERFLGCVFMRKQLQKLIQTEDYLTLITPNEPGVVLFRVDGLQCQVYLNQIHMQSLHLKASQAPHIPTPDGKQPYQFAPEELQIIEQYFEMRVASPPYRSASLNGFTRMLNVPPQVLKDCIKIMRLELFPDIAGLKWNVQFCLRVPPPSSIIPIGMPAVVICRLKVLFYIRIARAKSMMPAIDIKDGNSLVLPIIYDVMSNATQLAEKREQVQSLAMNVVGNHLRRFIDFYVQQHTECSFFPAIRHLAENLTLPNEPPNAPPTMPQMQQNQIVSTQLGGPSPNPAMMQSMGQGPMSQIGPNQMVQQGTPMQQQQQQHQQQQQQQPYGGMVGPGGPN